MRIIPTAGAPIDLGATEVSPTVGITDYSRRVTDDFGVTTVVERGFSRRMSVRLALPFETVDGVQRTLAALRATAATWEADDRFAWLQPTGFYKDFEVDLAVPPLSFCTLTVEGLAENGGVADAGADPAPEGSDSTLRMLLPVRVTDAVLASSSVPENDHPLWAAGTSYPAGFRVLDPGLHRIFESLTAGNIGNPPATSPAHWLDAAPTNRWAMFDEALGTATSIGAGPIVVTFEAGAIGAVALLDVTGTAAQVEVIAAGNPVPVYDRTILAEGGTLAFLDLPGIAGTVRVTVSGPGTVSVGTLLLGGLLGLGLTEASPTAGISDFSRKEVDEFGGVTIVQRAWAKRMSARSLIRTDALDVVADRIAAVRARPVLWIGDAGLDSLTVYGFFRDFSIEVGETTAKLSLSIEGLSKAQPVAPLIDLSPIALRIDEVEADLARIASDGYLNAGEKPQAIIDHGALLADLTALSSRYVALGSPADITPFRDDAVAAFNALDAYLSGLAPSWTDTAVDTPIIGATYRQKWVDAYEAVSTFHAAITGRPGSGGTPGAPGETVTLVKVYKRAPAGAPPPVPSATVTVTFAGLTLSGLTNGWTRDPQATNGQPQWVSAAPAASTGPTDTIASGEWATPVPEVEDGLDGQAGENGITATVVHLYHRNDTGIAPAPPSSTLTFNFVNGVLSGSLGVWTQADPDPAGGRFVFRISAAAITVAPSTTDTIASGEWTPAQRFVKDGDPGPAGFTLSGGGSASVAATSGGTPKTGELPKTFTMKVMQGTTDRSDEAATTYAVTASSGCTASLGGTNGKVLSVTAMSADTAAVTVTIYRSGVAIGTQEVKLSKARDGGSSTTGQDDTLAAMPNSGSDALLGSFSLLVANGAQLKVSGSVQWQAGSGGSQTYGGQIRASYTVDGTETYGSYYDGDIVATQFEPAAASFTNDPVYTNSSGAVKSVTVKLYGRRSVGTAASINTSGIVEASAS